MKIYNKSSLKGVLVATEKELSRKQIEVNTENIAYGN
jgi:hypothetical protein